ncbi:DUF3224 domain-containing protein [Stakelama tenebrarum]|uniref:DUF3224 domain-containing protein n=1 Tax=Stakelama tenebrarum TaxID=2711215 RepID=A0A6G6Y271_9SPHN|nr:DUF3224 domain-containing protein [Sphingosinithalassobacter tenebrarum]QIG79022.1 DUF3224 domain-containing protein [Sphingosinithalassobacter tenebrarum]
MKRLRPVVLARAALCLIVVAGTTAAAQPPVDAAAEDGEARGTFEVRMAPAGTVGDTIGAMSMVKTFSGDLQAISNGRMLASGDPAQSAAYVAMETVTGTLDGRSGGFVLVHRGIVDDGEPELLVTVVPGSGTGELAGLSGRMEISVADGRHDYVLRYRLPD